MKEKRFYKTAFIAILGTAALSVLFSLIYFIADERIDGGTLMYILYYVKVVCDLLANFVGYGTIIYAMTHFGWYDSLKVSGVYFLTILMYWIYQKKKFFDSHAIGVIHIDQRVKLVINNFKTSLGVRMCGSGYSSVCQGLEFHVFIFNYTVPDNSISGVNT